MTTVIRINLLYSQTAINHSRARRHTVQNANKQHIHSAANVIFCPLKANTWRLENKSCNRNEPKQYTNKW